MKKVKMARQRIQAHTFSHRTDCLLLDFSEGFAREPDRIRPETQPCTSCPPRASQKVAVPQAPLEKMQLNWGMRKGRGGGMFPFLPDPGLVHIGMPFLGSRAFKDASPVE